jgi:hypothetical protein
MEGKLHTTRVRQLGSWDLNEAKSRGDLYLAVWGQAVPGEREPPVLDFISCTDSTKQYRRVMRLCGEDGQR